MGDPRETAVNDLSKVMLYLVVPRFEHGTLWTHAEQRNHSAMVAFKWKYSIELAVLEDNKNRLAVVWSKGKMLENLCL
jgi:hypothetical protein